MSGLTKRQKQILQSYAIHDKEPDISTEQLFARVQDDTGAEANEICDALAAEKALGDS